MEDYKDYNRKPRRSFSDAPEMDNIVYSQSIKAGKRIYYIDVKKDRRDELFVSITESKKIVTGYDENERVSFEKHKIFIYKEDFMKISEGFQNVIEYIEKENAGNSNFGEKEDVNDEESERKAARWENKIKTGALDAPEEEENKESEEGSNNAAQSFADLEEDFK